MNEPVCVRLTPRYDAARLAAELASIVAQFRHKELAGGYHRGSWSGIALIAGGGQADFVDSYAFATDDAGPRPTEALFQAPYLREILESLDAPKSSARILFLSAGSRINEHKDPPVNFQTGMLRLHLPLVTHPRVVMTLGGERTHWAAGELWWGDFSQIHSVDNDSPIDRAHLVIDCAITEGILALFPDDFVARQRQVGIAMHSEPLAVAAADLARYECRFRFSRFVFPSPKPMSGEGRVALEGDALRLYLQGEPRFKLTPLAVDVFGLAGWPTGMKLYFELRDGRVSGLVFEVRGMPEIGTFLPIHDPRIPVRRIPLTVTP